MLQSGRMLVQVPNEPNAEQSARQPMPQSTRRHERKRAAAIERTHSPRNDRQHARGTQQVAGPRLRAAVRRESPEAIDAMHVPRDTFGVSVAVACCTWYHANQRVCIRYHSGLGRVGYDIDTT